MSFINLSGNLQDIILYQTDFLLKIFLLFMIIGVSLYYLFVFKKGQKPTEFKSVAFARMAMTINSFFILLMSPLMLVFLHPSYLFVNLYTIFLFMYTISAGLFIWLMGMDIIKVDSKFHDEVTRWFKRNFK